MPNQVSGHDLPNVYLGIQIFCTISTVLSDLFVKIQLTGKRKPSWSNSCLKLICCWLPLLVEQHHKCCTCRVTALFYTPFTLACRNRSERSRTVPNISVNATVPSRTVPERNGCGCRYGMVQNGSLRKCKRKSFRNRSHEYAFRIIASRYSI